VCVGESLFGETHYIKYIINNCEAIGENKKRKRDPNLGRGCSRRVNAGYLLEAKRKGPLCWAAVMRQSIFKERAFGVFPEQHDNHY